MEAEKLISSDLYLGEDHRYHIDFEDFEKKIKGEKIRLFLLCSPHNPVGLDAEELDRRIIHQAKLWLDSGKIFGDSGKGFQRINVACPRSVLKEALQKLKKICIDR